MNSCPCWQGRVKMGYVVWMSDPSGRSEASYQEKCRATVDIQLLCLDSWGPELGSECRVQFRTLVSQAETAISVVWMNTQFLACCVMANFHIPKQESVGKEETRICKPNILTIWLFLDMYTASPIRWKKHCGMGWGFIKHLIISQNRSYLYFSVN